MRNHIPRLKTLKYTKTKEEIEDKDYGRIILIKSDNPNFEYEVYDFKSGIFRGYTGNKNFKEKREESNLENVD
jgi:hypothetical protein